LLSDPNVFPPDDKFLSLNIDLTPNGLESSFYGLSGIHLKAGRSIQGQDSLGIFNFKLN
jgi:hypothetical protein